MSDPNSDGRGAVIAAAAAALLVVHAILAWRVRVPGVMTGNDDAIYLMLARSLRGWSYRDLQYVGSPLHSQYPPVYPALLAATGALFHDRLAAYVGLATLTSTAALAFLFDAMRRRLPLALALTVLAVCAVNPPLLLSAGEIMSEAPYMALSFIALWCLALPPSRATTIGAALAAIAASLTRSAGVTLLAGVVLVWFLERRPRAALGFAAASAGTVGAWLAWTVFAPHKVPGRSYAADAMGAADAVGMPVESPGLLPLFAARIFRNGTEYLTSVLPYSLPVPTLPGTKIDNALWLVVIVGCGVAGAWVLRSRFRPALLYLVAYATLLLVWTWPVPRFLRPILPLVILAMLAGAAALTRRWRWPWLAPSALALAMMGTAIARDGEFLRFAAECDYARPLRSPGCANPDQRAFFAAADWIRVNTPPDAVFISARDASFAFLAGRRLIPTGEAVAQDSAHFAEFLTRRGVRFAFIGHVGTVDDQLARVLRRNCAQLDVVRRFPPHGLLFRLAPAGGAAGPEDACAAMERYKRDAGPLLPTLR